MSDKDAAIAKWPIWHLVIEQLRTNPNAVVQCPFCRNGPLSIREVPYSGAGPSHPIARLITCELCHEKAGDVPLIQSDQILK
jgi:hypothetical protein